MRFFGSGGGAPARAAASIFFCLMLACCAVSAPSTRWVKTGLDDAATARELQACRTQAARVLATQQGINADITATLGGNWQRSNTFGLQTQSLDRSAAAVADRAVASCMRAKGFARAG